MLRNSEKGQTLIEVVITLGIALIIITSILVLVNASNRRATIARQATQASKLAQDTVTVTRLIFSDSNGAGLSAHTSVCVAEISSSEISTVRSKIVITVSVPLTRHQDSVTPPQGGSCNDDGSVPIAEA